MVRFGMLVQGRWVGKVDVVEFDEGVWVWELVAAGEDFSGSDM